ncbi:MAG: beta-propeller fold lactonase family protein [Deltaproteobacteria bacterium]|nr:beta-propeller fold lactonase family protein [Deltaproteobacteria bacterium]
MHNYAFVLAIFGLAACSGDDKEDTGTGADDTDDMMGDTDDMMPDDTDDMMPDDTDDTDDTMPDEGDGFVYAMTNGAAGNEVVALRRMDSGLEFMNAWPTGGQGLGTVELPLLMVDDGIDPLVSEGSLQRVGDHLLAVNAGSGSVSVFEVADDGMLTLTDTEQVGSYPNTLASHGDRVFVGLSPATDAVGGIAQLLLGADGMLTPAGDMLSFTVPEAHPGRVLVVGDFLVATELMQGNLDVWMLGADGAALNMQPVTTPSAGPGPFGAIALGPDRLLVSEAAPEMPNLASVSTYEIDDMGALHAITAALPNGQTASCWEVVTPDGQYAFTSNSGNGTLSSYALAADGSVTLLEGAAQTPGSGPIDMSLAPDGSMLFVLLGASGEIAAYPVTNGVLGAAMLLDDTHLPVQGSQGILAW